MYSEFGVIYSFDWDSETFKAWVKQFPDLTIVHRHEGKDFQIATAQRRYGMFETAAPLIIASWTGDILKNRDGEHTIQQLIAGWTEKGVDVPMTVGSFAFEARSKLEQLMLDVGTARAKLVERGYNVVEPALPFATDKTWDNPIAARLTLQAWEAERGRVTRALSNFDTPDHHNELRIIGDLVLSI